MRRPDQFKVRIKLDCAPPPFDGTVDTPALDLASATRIRDAIKRGDMDVQLVQVSNDAP